MPKKCLVVMYNDCYGNGDKSVECIINSQKDFPKWLEKTNREREKIEAPEYLPEEFDLIPIEFFDFQSGD